MNCYRSEKRTINNTKAENENQYQSKKRTTINTKVRNHPSQKRSTTKVTKRNTSKLKQLGVERYLRQRRHLFPRGGVGVKQAAADEVVSHPQQPDRFHPASGLVGAVVPQHIDRVNTYNNTPVFEEFQKQGSEGREGGGYGHAKTSQAFVNMRHL